jgi:small subunit ribosomal protein S21
MSDYHKNNRKSRNNFKPRKEGDNKAVVVSNDKFAHIQPVQAQPLEVRVYNNNFDKALRAFRALVQKERILSTYKEKQSYEKPSDKRRRRRNEMKRKRQELNGFGSQERTSKSFKPRKNSSSSGSPE